MSGRSRLFGTDGVRGRVGFGLTAELALRLGRASVVVLGGEGAKGGDRIQAGVPGGRDPEVDGGSGPKVGRGPEVDLGSGPVGGRGPKVLVIRDTRESGEMLEAAVVAGVTAAGGDVFLGGVLPTPAAPLLIARYGFDLGVVISASHNPYHDNGIKLFGSNGHKLSDEQEIAIEGRLGESGSPGDDLACGRSRRLMGAGEDYLRELHVRFGDVSLDHLKVVLDCANGSTHQVAPEIFRRLGATVAVIGDRPDGQNINEDCGSTHVQGLAEAVVANGGDIGFAFDGDGDRVMAVDRTGRIVDGDELMALCAIHLRDVGGLDGGGVVVTVMTNYGFHRAMAAENIEVVTTGVGDRNVLEELRGRGWVLGGEQSGHVIEMSFNPSGDGIATALLTLEALSGGDLSERAVMVKLPQRLVNVTVGDRDAAMASEEVLEAVGVEDGALRGRGRVLVRPSGTEPLVRVMVEAPTDREAGEVCGRLVGLIERLGL